MVGKSREISFHHNLIFLSPHCFGISHKAYTKLCKISKRLEELNGCYGRARFHETWVKDTFRTYIPHCTRSVVLSVRWMMMLLQHVYYIISTNEISSQNKAHSLGNPFLTLSLQWRHYERCGVSNRFDCLLSRLLRPDQRKHQSYAWRLWGESTGDWWIPVTKGH